MKNLILIIVLITIALTLSFVNHCSATIVYHQPLSSPWSGLGSNDPASEFSDQRVADVFSLTTSEPITDVTWYGYFSQGQISGVVTNFDIRFYYDAGGTPVNSAPFAAQSVTAVSQETGVITTGDNNTVFSYSATLPTPVDISDGTFWISIVENDPATTIAWEWSHTSFEGVGRNAVWHQNSGWTSQASLNSRADRAFILEANSLQPNISTSPTSHNFGNVTVGGTPSLQTFTISNTGNADLNIWTISLTGTDVSDFVIQFENCAGLVFAPLDTCTIDVLFSPISIGAKSANLSITSDDPDTLVLNVPLSGTGIDPYAVDDDGDGYTEYQNDCNDNDPNINPDACDIKRDGIDQDCDGTDRTKGKPCSDSGGDYGGHRIKEVICDDGEDNDGDGLIDCDDRDCKKACRG